ncbi:chemotaxis protein CheB [Chamaesiphon minutus]|uniref:Protein-glutamate methylesterase/protein-glutamine glutaminase n=1 Tax=Chamaesiphon minutus (strain ATCC 27169 / PCC 6605) TaxID=1173020 RepID=K9UKK9_CHAP6|nr:chemotaxis protein CheB [Chamaesiphon minutus]AFY95340.1 chemotaxis response regulator containing a CheY-like receiver domain and a methylesterase domain [Chamaesiphon minutus PCC 6605]
MSRIKVILVDDSPIALELLQRLLRSSSEVEVVGTARNGREALALIPQVNPNVICTDLHMSPIDGLELTKEVMAKFPRPILVVSNSVREDDTRNIFGLLQAGAVDIFPKPNGGEYSEYERVKDRLLAKIQMLSQVKVKAKTAATTVPSSNSVANGNDAGTLRAIAIGASTGGPQAIHKILTTLPQDLPIPIICAQHIGDGFLTGLISWLKEDSKLNVKVAQIGEIPAPRTVYFAPERAHLEFDTEGKFIYSNFTATTGTCPSIDALFRSVARVYGRSSASMILTGAGNDGVAGTEAIAAAGGLTIAQDQSSCLVFGMSKAAIATGSVGHILNLSEIAPFILSKINTSVRSA